MAEPKVITCTGYYNTGSSAIGDILKEFDCVQDYGDVELRIAHEPDGLADLEYNIVENNHRHNTSNAIKRFMKLCKYYNGNIISKRYRAIFGEKFITYCKEYIESLIQLKCKSWWQFDQIYKGKVIYFVDVLYSRLYKKIHFWKDPTQIRGTLFCKNEMAYFTYISESEFINKTQIFTSKLINECWDKKSDYLILDQLIPSTNTSRYIRYYRNLKVIIVDRDPRDIYLLELENPYGVVPTDVREFCLWYKIIREHKKYEKHAKEVLCIQFEDLIYKYEQTRLNICKFVGINEKLCTDKLHYFKPSVSINNTRKWLNTQYKNEIEYIEDNLSEYLYDYTGLENNL